MNVIPPTPLATQLDHLVMGTADLARGAAWLERYLGVTLSPVGRHVRMATHNRLLSLGPDCYLELIAIDPDGGDPFMKRWFGLDIADVRERIAVRPRLLGWVARSNPMGGGDIDGLAAKCGGLLGGVHAMERGDFKWRITLPEDGYPVEGGLVPNIIQWDVPFHPCQRLPDQQCRFEWMEAAHPNPPKVAYLLDEMGLLNRLVLASSPAYSGMTMCAYLRTPLGPRTLMS